MKYNRCRFCGQALKLVDDKWEHVDNHPATPEIVNLPVSVSSETRTIEHRGPARVRDMR